MGSEEKDESLRDDVFKLSAIADCWLLLADRLREPLTQEEIGPAFALFYTLTMLKNLYFLKVPSWEQVRDTINLGLVKDTKKYGNTSVSMGAAAQVFGKIEGKSAGFLNGGTGGVKYQYYSTEGGILHVVGEYKPKETPMPSSLKVANYSPKTAVSIEDSIAVLARNLSAPELPWNPKEVPMYAFVTGTIRQHWEEASDEVKQQLEQEMKKLFEPHNIQPLGSSYFMSQDDEGTLELLGAKALYRNLVTNHLLDEGIEIVGSFGIGRGSCQWMIMRKNGVPELVGHKAGMANLPELSKVSKTLMDAYKDPEKFRVFLESVSGIAKPTIALKSGATLLMEMKAFAHIKPELTTTRSYETRTVRVAVVTAKDKEAKITWTGSLDRLCALAMLELGSEEELCTIYREQEGKLQRLSRGSVVEPDELLLLGPVVIHGSGIPEPVVATSSSSSSSAAAGASSSSAAGAAADATPSSSAGAAPANTPANGAASSSASPDAGAKPAESKKGAEAPKPGRRTCVLL